MSMVSSSCNIISLRSYCSLTSNIPKFKSFSIDCLRKSLVLVDSPFFLISEYGSLSKVTWSMSEISSDKSSSPMTTKSIAWIAGSEVSSPSISLSSLTSINSIYSAMNILN